jgi:DNA-directed RNA polymerase subunit RPC12/RpoP
MSGRIVLHLDRGLGWTKPQSVARCGLCGAELARHPNPDRALRAARRRRCPACGTRSTRRLPGTTSLAADLALALARGQSAPLSRRRWPPARHPARVPRAGRR